MPTSGDTAEHILHRVDFTAGTLPDEIGSLYADLVSQYGVHDVVVLKRFSSGTEVMQDQLRRQADIVEQPHVDVLVGHAHRIIDRLSDPPYRLSSYERSYLFHQFLEAWDWETPYLSEAATHESFIPDVERFSIVASWQGTPITTDEVLGELTAAHEAFQSQLDENGYLEHAKVIHAAAAALDDGLIDRSSPSAVIVLETEDFTSAERDYVQAYTQDAETHWVTNEQSSVQRTRNESGTIQASDFEEDVAIIDHSSPAEGSLIDAVATQLATGRTLDITDTEDQVAVLSTETFSDQVGAITEEIERLRETTQIRYDDIAIVLKDNRSPIREVIETLNGRGIPTASTTVSGLGEDPAARELYTVVNQLADPDDDPTGEQLLTTRVGADPPLDQIRDEANIVEGLWTWIRSTDLKQRIAENESEIDARTQFAHVTDIIELTSFVEESPLVETTWAQLRSFIEFAFDHAAPDAYGEDIESPEGGVLVDAAQRFKTGNWDTVFIINAIDQEYPSDPQINRIFPRPHLERIPEYPMVSAPTAADVTTTFETADRVDTRPFRAYYSHYSRRLMGVGARAADKRLYFTTYRQRQSDPGKYRRPSRFLSELRDKFPQIDEVSEDEIRTESRAVEYTVDSIDHALDRIRRAPTAEDELDLDEIERKFGAIQRLLAKSSRSDEITAAIAARADFAEGAVRRE